MDLAAFKATLDGDAPPPGVGLALQALWHEARGDWDRAHALAQRADGEAEAWVHAYLHRVEGDLANADHWYQRTGRPRAEMPVAKEWERIAEALLG